MQSEDRPVPVTGRAGSPAFESFVLGIDSPMLDFRESLDLEALDRLADAGLPSRDV